MRVCVCVCTVSHTNTHTFYAWICTSTLINNFILTYRNINCQFI